MVPSLPITLLSYRSRVITCSALYWSVQSPTWTRRIYFENTISNNNILNLVLNVSSFEGDVFPIINY